MKRLLQKIISECYECPYYKWNIDISESNTAGSSECKLLKTVIAWGDKYPEIPKWCPLKKLNEIKKRT